YIQRIPYASQEAVEFADLTMELISYHAILASSELAAQRGPYPSYQGSKWDRGLLPIDTIDLLEQERGEPVEMNRDRTQDWGLVRSRINRDGMRNSNVLAIAPTATISNIAGVSQSIEPIYRNLYAKSNLSGDFTILNPYLVRDLQRLDLWDRRMIEDLKYYDGVLAEISRIPEDLRRLYLAATQIEPAWLIECAARRQKWIDMGQSLNLYIATPSGKAVDEMYFLAWRRGLKTTYYLRSFAPTQIEKTSIDINARAIQPRWMKSESASSRIAVKRAEAPAEVRSTVNGLVCDPFDEECEACQ
ncbi:MAG: ribonucleoside-diphosphate reductase subunit alpha, partial [Chloroflexota bacterium]|nr:ribonucleoside-diphosphate reductase subunit alpha [Chloroflexota bacterium]